MDKDGISRILVTGFGGQGIVLAGYIMGKAATIYDGQEATLIQSYGPEARGGACSAEVIISPEYILYPYFDEPDILVAMSQEAYNKFSTSLNRRGTLLFDDSLVTPGPGLKNKKVFSISATRMAEEMGKKVVANIIMLGFFSAVTGRVSKKAMEEAIHTSVPKGTIELNLKAFNQGFEYGKTAIQKEGAGTSPCR